MTRHHIVITRDDETLAALGQHGPVCDENRRDHYMWRIECSDPASCPGWVECAEDHDGYDPEDEDSPAFDEYEGVMIHCVPHDWHGSFWTVEYAECPVAASWADLELPDDIDTGTDGRHLVDVEWEETCCYLTLSDPEKEN